MVGCSLGWCCVGGWFIGWVLCWRLLSAPVPMEVTALRMLVCPQHSACAHCCAPDADRWLLLAKRHQGMYGRSPPHGSSVPMCVVVQVGIALWHAVAATVPMAVTALEMGATPAS